MMQLTVLSIHCPIALLACFKMLRSQDMEIQINISKILSVVAAADDTCREVGHDYHSISYFIEWY